MCALAVNLSLTCARVHYLSTDFRGVDTLFPTHHMSSSNGNAEPKCNDMRVMSLPQESWSCSMCACSGCGGWDFCQWAHGCQQRITTMRERDGRCGWSLSGVFGLCWTRGKRKKGKVLTGWADTRNRFHDLFFA